MKQRQRRLIGTIATVLFLTGYVLVAMAVGGDIAVGRGLLVELAVFILLGVAWVPVVMLLILWMSRADP